VPQSPGLRHSHFGDSSDPPMRDQPAALIWRHLIFLDCASNGRLLVRSIDNDADELRGGALDVINGSGKPARLFLLALSARCAPGRLIPAAARSACRVNAMWLGRSKLPRKLQPSPGLCDSPQNSEAARNLSGARTICCLPVGTLYVGAIGCYDDADSVLRPSSPIRKG
jgi:hypothetical protein